MAVITPARVGKLRLNAGRLAYVAPTIPSNPNPPHQSIAGPLALSWTCTPALFEVYFGTTTTPPLVGTTRSLGWVLPPLTLGATYYWRIIATANGLGAAAPGPLWSFTAAVPVAPVYVSPPHHSTNQPTTVTLSWTQPQTVPGDIVFDVYFGPTPSPALVQRRQSATTYTPPPLRDGVDYYWRIVAINNIGSASGPIWTFETRNPTKGLITIGGIDVRARVRIAGVSVRDLLADTPNTAAFTIEGTAPTVGKEVRIGLATLTGDDVLFGGYIDTVDAAYDGRPESRSWRVTAQDYTYGLNRRKVRVRYAQQSATTIAQALLALAPTGYTGTHIVAGLPVVTGGIDFTEEDLTTCFARLAARIGGYWFVDYAKDIHLFLTESTAAPTPITRAARVLLNDPAIHWSSDLTQVRTRVFVEGGGSSARALVAVGATSLPVIDASWYSPSGGLVVSGPQRIRYTGKGTVGGPAAPTATGQAVVGALGAGPYSYVTTQIIAGAESPLSAPSAPVVLSAVAAPPLTITLAATFSGVTPPPTAPAMAAFLSGVAPPTTPVTVAFVSTAVPAPTTAPAATPVVTVVSAPPAGMTGAWVGNPGSIAAGSYSYVATYATATGDTTASQEVHITASGGGLSINLTNIQRSGDGRVIARRLYRATWQSPGGYYGPYKLVATINDNTSTSYLDTKADASLGATLVNTNTTATGKLIPTGTYNWQVTFVTSAGETTPGPRVQVMNPGTDSVDLSSIPISPDPRVTQRRIYRTIAADSNGTARYEGTIPNNTATTFRSGIADASLGAAPPTTNTSGNGGLVAGHYHAWAVTFVTASGETQIGTPAYTQVPGGTDQASLSAIPIGTASVIARRVYRAWFDGANWQAFLLVATLNDNVTTTYLDTKTNAQLGKQAPTTNTTGGGGLVPGVSYWWVVTFGTASGETTVSPQGGITIPADCDMVALSAIPTSPDARVTKRKIYRYGGATGVWQLEATIADNITTTFTSSKTDGALGAAGLPPANTTGTGNLIPGSWYAWTVKYVTATGESAAAQGIGLVMPANTDSVQVSAIPTSSDARVTKRKLYRTAAGGAAYRFEVEIADNVTTTYASTKADASLGADMIPGNTTSAGGQIAVAAIAVGGGTTTARKLYRTESGGASYKLVATIADNTTTTYQDNKSDASLGALAPLDLVTELIGIPATGAGSILYEIRQGDDVNIFVQCDDVPAQTALAAMEGAPSQGIVEHVLQDRRLALAAATATGNADLALFARPIVTIQYATRDPKTRSGKTVQINLPELSLVGDFTIQNVEIDEIDMHPGLYPQYRVTCSSVRFSFEDAVRRFKLDVAGTE